MAKLHQNPNQFCKKSYKTAYTQNDTKSFYQRRGRKANHQPKRFILDIGKAISLELTLQAHGVQDGAK